MIREMFLSELKRTLSLNDFFSCYDFNIIEEKQNTVKIIFLSDDRYYFKFAIPTAKTEMENKYGKDYLYIYSATVSPWASAVCEEIGFRRKENLLNAIIEWMKYLKEDLINTPINRKILEHEKKLNEFYEILNNMEDEYLSEEEMNLFVSRIDELEKNMVNNINELNKKAEEKDRIINSLKNEFDTLKEKMDIFNKKGFFKSFASKIMTWSLDPNNQKLIGNGVAFVRNMIEHKKD